MEKSVMSKLLVFEFLFLLCGFAVGKECTNILPALSSHTFRYELLASDNDTLKEEMFAHYHLTPTDDSAWSSLFPRKMLKGVDERNWAKIYRNMKNSFQSSSGDFLKEVSLHDVRLHPSSIQWRAQQTNLEYLLMLDVDRLVWSFRKTAGLPTPGNPYGGWEAPNIELRGHFVGHYMSASALMWASTHNDVLKERMSALVSALSECQQKMNTGYLSAFPTEWFDRLEALKPVWAPYYTIHKIMAGLLDQYTFAGNAQALKMVTWMADYFYKRVQNVVTKYTVERHYLTLNDESGGMNDVLYRLFNITGDVKQLVLAHLFDKPCFLGLLAVQAEDISGFHSNTHIPLVIGSQMRYEIVGDPLYKEIGKFFMESINASHSYATGGTSHREFWSDPKRIATQLGSQTEESCTTYNMLKVSRNLFRWTKEMPYADYYERAITNGVLSIQRGTEPGIMIYFLPLGPGSSKNVTVHRWGTPFNSFWCCYGTATESFSKLGDSIYFEDDRNDLGLYIIQYVSSSLNWKSGKIMLNQTVDPVFSTNSSLRVSFSISSKECIGKASTLHLRIPSWTHSTGAKAAINSQNLTVPAPGNVLSITRKWSNGDKITLELPINLRIEAIKDDRPEYASVHAILYGPYLLVGHSHGHWNIKSGSSNSLSDYITPIHQSYNDHLITFSQVSGESQFVLANLNHSLAMEKFPKYGTNGSLFGTFRLISDDVASNSTFKLEDFIGRSVMLEPFNLPGKILVQKGKEDVIVVANSASEDGSSLFHLVLGLDGKNGTVSLESVKHKGCYVFSGANYDGTPIKLSCKPESSPDTLFNQGSSFVMSEGLSKYHPLSFVAKGDKQNFLLQPLLSFMDEFYTVYFNITA